MKRRGLLGGNPAGFTLIEVLVVVAILGVLAAVVVPSVAVFTQSGYDEAVSAEIRSVETAVTAMLSDARTGTITNPVTDTSDLSNCSTTVNGTTYYLSSYLNKANNLTCRYTITADGIVTQNCD